MTGRQQASCDAWKLSHDEVAELYAVHAEVLRHFLLGLSQCPSQVEDYLQQVFVIAAERGGECAADARRAWLLRTAHNLVLADRRQRAVREKILRGLSHQRTGATPGGEFGIHAVVREEQFRRLRDAVGRLSDDEQRIVWMRVRDCLKFREIAQRLDLPLGTVLTRMRRALVRLHEELQDP